MARAIWKGILRIADESVPVKLYSAVESRTVHFRLLHEPDRIPVRQQMVHAETGEVVPAESVQKGYEVEPGVFVVLSDEDLEEARPKPSRDIRLLRFVPPDRIDGRWYDRPYYLGPDGDAESYFALCDALRRAHLEGVARWTMRNQEYVGALFVRGDHLVLNTLRHAGEVVDATALPAPAGRPLSDREVAMAEQLVSALAGPFEADAFEDEYRQRVLELIESKAAGRAVRPRKEAPKRASGSLEEILQRSVAAAQKGRKSA